MLNSLKLSFKKGLKDGLPIAIGYLSVSFAYGMLAVSKGLPVYAPILISITNFTGTGQFVGTDMLIAGAMLSEIALTLFIINARYILMSIALSQRFAISMKWWQRMILAFGNTDEVFAVAMSKNSILPYRYMTGLIIGSFWGWVAGTALGALLGSFIPAGALLSAMGIALYAMFIAIIIPDCRRSRHVCFVVAISIMISVIFRYTPYLNQIKSYIVIIIAAIISSLLGTFIFPTQDEIEPPPYIDNRDYQQELEERTK